MVWCWEPYHRFQTGMTRAVYCGEHDVRFLNNARLEQLHDSSIGSKYGGRGTQIKI